MTTLLISFNQEVLNQHLNLVTPEYPFFESPWVRISPFLTCSSLPQRLHRSPTANLPGDPYQPER